MLKHSLQPVLSLCLRSRVLRHGQGLSRLAASSAGFLRRDARAARIAIPIAILVALAMCGQLSAQEFAQQLVPPGESTPQAPLPQALPGLPPAGGNAPLVYKVRGANERIEMTVNTSRILTLEQRIPQAQVNNPEVLDLTPLSPNEIQISANIPGATQVNLWGEDKTVYTIDVIVFADAEALNMLLRSQFPNSTLKVIPVANGVLLSGYVDRPEHVDLIVRIAEEYYPKVINNITVGGVQQVLLHAKVMEVSRTKLRKLGVDWAYFNSNDFVVSSVSGLITAATGSSVTTSGQETFVFGVVDGSSAFFGVLDALRQDDLAKVLAEPTLVTVSGRPAQFNSGGEFPVPVPQSLGTISIEFKKYGTQLDFVPIVLGNGLIRLEVRPRVSELDKSRSLTIAGTTVPGLRMREVETGVELRAGQTLAIAGLVYYRSEGQTRGLPLISDVPYLGIPFRKVSEEANELELLIMVTPELVEPMNLSQVPPCGPGMQTTNGNDCELYFKGFLEVPVCCPTCEGSGCEACQGGGLPSEGMIGPVSEFDSTQNSVRSSGGSGFATAQPGSPQGRQIPVASQNRARPTAGVGNGGEPSFIGPIGYDVVN